MVEFCKQNRTKVNRYLRRFFVLLTVQLNPKLLIIGMVD